MRGPSKRQAAVCDGAAAAKGFGSSDSSHYDELWPCWYLVCPDPGPPAPVLEIIRHWLLTELQMG